jgi:ABC-type xylose transport system substrate-binding protein
VAFEGGSATAQLAAASDDGDNIEWLQVVVAALAGTVAGAVAALGAAGRARKPALSVSGQSVGSTRKALPWVISGRHIWVIVGLGSEVPAAAADRRVLRRRSVR